MTPHRTGYNIIAEYKEEWANLYFRSDDIVEVHLLPGVYNGTKVLHVIERIKALSGKSKLLVLTITDRRSMSTYSGVKAVFSKPAVDYSVAKAYLFHNKLQFFLANVGRLVFRPTIPIRFFKSRETAETWLHSFRGYGM
jgi:hypothetical protein